MKMKCHILFLFIGILSFYSCNSNAPEAPAAPVKTIDNRVIIVDITGKEWDVTDAQKKYGMNAEDFQYGIGSFAITPILDPQMRDPGDPGYPDASGDFLVIGVTLNGFTRAYGLDSLRCHEIALEEFGDEHVAVAY